MIGHVFGAKANSKVNPHYLRVFAAMPFRNITEDFLEIVRDKTNAIPELRRKKFVRLDGTQSDPPTIDKNYVAEAQNIVITLDSSIFVSN